MGNLFIMFKVVFPDSLNEAQMSLLQQALGKGEEKKKKSSKKKKGKREESKDEEFADEVVEMKEFKDWHKNTHHGGGDKGNESEEDDEEGGHGQRIGC